MGLCWHHCFRHSPVVLHLRLCWMQIHAFTLRLALADSGLWYSVVDVNSCRLCPSSFIWQCNRSSWKMAGRCACNQATWGCGRWFDQFWTRFLSSYSRILWTYRSSGSTLVDHERDDPGPGLAQKTWEPWKLYVVCSQNQVGLTILRL